MSASPSRRRRPKGKGSGGGGGDGAKRNTKGRRPNKARPAVEPDRPFWVNEAGEAAVRELIGSMRPTQDPTALVRSLGSPPLGRFADSAQHYYAPVYEKAQRFAIAMATANGVVVIGQDDDVDHATGDGAPGDATGDAADR